MWVDIDDLRKEIKRLERENEEELDKSEKLLMSQAFISGEITAYYKIEQMLDEMEEVYRKQGLEHIKSLREEGNEEQREI